MVPVGGKLWCGSQNRVLIINTTTLVQEVGGQIAICVCERIGDDADRQWRECNASSLHLSTGSRWAQTAAGAWLVWWRTVRGCGWRCRVVHRSDCTTLRAGRAWQRWTWRLPCIRCLQVNTHAYGRPIQLIQVSFTYIKSHSTHTHTHPLHHSVISCPPQVQMQSSDSTKLPVSESQPCWPVRICCGLAPAQVKIHD